MSEWQPIETAPEEEVLLYFPGIDRGRPETRLYPMIKVDHPRVTTRKPTHWMPLPAPPKERGGCTDCRPSAPGDCDTCGEHSTRLTDGMCAACRDRLAVRP